MNVKMKHATALLSAMGLALLSGSAAATNGYFTHGVGTESKGMAGTGIGSNAANGPIVIASNPALGVFASDSWEVGLSAFSPRRSYTASSSLALGSGGAFTIGPSSIDSSSEWFPIPYVAKNWRMDNGNALTFVFYGRGGMNTDWDDSNASAWLDPTGAGGMGVEFDGTFGGGHAGVDLSQAFMSLNYSGTSGDNFAWGIGPVFAFQVFEATGVAQFTGFTKTFASSILSGGGPVPANSLTDNGHDSSSGFGAAAGVWWAMGESVSAGLAYQSKISMGEFKDYSDLFAEDGGFDIPSSTKLGISFNGNNDVRVNLDIEHTKYSEVASVGNSLANIGACPTAGLGGTDLESCLGGKNGAGFGWDDMTTFKLGIEWASDPDMVWRFGYSYGEQPIHEDDVLFNILAPGVMEQHVTFGLSKKAASGGTWNYALMYAPTKTVTGVNLFDPTQTIKLKMSQFEFEVSYLW